MSVETRNIDIRLFTLVDWVIKARARTDMISADFQGLVASHDKPNFLRLFM